VRQLAGERGREREHRTERDREIARV